ncbi:MAG TPA: hypothetical protein VIG29_21060 [Vicinamibacteria bacterium]|jgi:hypothetical protein
MRHAGFWLLSLVLLFTAFPVQATVVSVEALNEVSEEEEPSRLSELGILFLLHEDGFNLLRYLRRLPGAGPVIAPGDPLSSPGEFGSEDRILFEPILDARRSAGSGSSQPAGIVIQQVHEPQTVLLLTVGLALIGLRWRPRRRTKTSQ